MSESAVLECRGLCRTYRDGSLTVDVLKNVVFEGEQRPEPAIFEKLMEFVVTKDSSALSKSMKGVKTKQLSPFAGHCVDASPVMRSLILQLLLNEEASTEIAQGSLRQYLEQERRRFVANDNPKQLMDLCLMVLRCLEDVFYRQEMQQTGLGDKEGATVKVVSPRAAFTLMKSVDQDERTRYRTWKTVDVLINVHCI